MCSCKRRLLPLLRLKAAGLYDARPGGFIGALAGSQLGLARIRYETGCELQMRVDDDVVTMSVDFPLKAGN